MLKSRTEWIMEGERNTRFFQVSTLVNRRKNRIRGLKNFEGNWIFDQREVRDLVNEFFKNLYKSWKESCPRRLAAREGMDFQEITNLTRALSIPVSNGEIWAAFRSLKPYKAPGLDGLHPGFLHRFWHLIGSSMIQFADS